MNTDIVVEASIYDVTKDQTEDVMDFVKAISSSC